MAAFSTSVNLRLLRLRLLVECGTKLDVTVLILGA